MMTPKFAALIGGLTVSIALVATTIAAQDPKTPASAQPKPSASGTQQPDLDPPSAPAATMDPELKSKASYVIGMTYGKNLQSQELDLDADQLVQGLRDALAGAESKVPEAEAEAVMGRFQEIYLAMIDAKVKSLASKNQAEGQAFLAQNKQKSGVTTTASGLQIQMTQPGTGASPKATDTVKVNYRGMLLDGTVFDSSYERNEPTSFPLNRVIPAWTEGLQLMKVGGKARLFVPPALGYGETGSGDQIGPNAVLVFDVELLEIVK